MTVVNLSELSTPVTSGLSNNKRMESSAKMKELQTAFSSYLQQNSFKASTQTESIVKQADHSKTRELYFSKESESVANKIQTIKPEEDIQKEELSQKTEQISDAIVQLLSQTFGITPEEVMKVLETSQLAPIELLSPTNLAQIVGTIQNNQDYIGLLNNSDFQMVLSEVSEITNSLLEDLGMSKEQLFAMCKLIVNEKQGESVLPQILKETQEETPESLQQNVVKITNEEATEVQLLVEGTKTDAIKPEQISEQTNKQLQAQPVTLDEASQMLNQTDAKGLTESIQVLDGQETEAQMENDSSKQGQNNMEFLSSNNDEKDFKADILAGQIQDNASVVMDKTVQALPTTVDLVNLMDRISEFTRISVGNQISSMEMQLNPENLGKVFVTVTSHHGEISAHISAQTEAAKEVIESQITQFKENLSQNGIKVQAVEVTIASHEFERSLDDQGQQFQQEQPEKRSNKRRMLNQESMQEDFLTGMMDEEDKVLASMMKDQGNTMDYQI